VAISAGTRLGSYEIFSPLGSGGMGEVWRARDTRLGREVAIKVLPEGLVSDPDRLRRFEKEARSASSLNHPNIVTIYEIGSLESTSFIAMELIEGKTLREAMGGSAMPLRKLLAIAPQIAEGLARAHEAGIVHRDLKPENVMITKDGLVKILDFGLAKLAYPERDSGQTASELTVSAVTRPGIAMGTAGYMSPEQASGHPVDFRSDQFSFGSMLYEMATGRPAFKRATTAQTLAAIIDEDPEPMPAIVPGTPAPLRWVVERCLAKEPEARYAATRDLVRELSTLRDHLSELSSGSGIGIETVRPRKRWRALALSAALLCGLAVTYLIGRRVEKVQTSKPRFHQLTFAGAGISTARFAPDGQTVVYSTQKEGRPPELFTVRLDSPETRSLGLPPAHILSISHSGEMALLLLRPFALSQRITHIAFEQICKRDPFLLDGTLARAPLAGGAPAEILEDVTFADWAPNGRDLAVAHRVGNKARIEFPIGATIDDEESELLNHPRVSRRAALAFKDWGRLLVKEAGRPLRRLPGTDQAHEIAWSDATGEIWYSSREAEPETEIRARTPSGHDRLVVNLPGDFVLYDISSDGRVLLGHVQESAEVRGSFPGESRERNLSHFDYSEALDLSPSGDTLLFGEGGQSGSGIYLRKTDGSPPKRLGKGDELGAQCLSPDGKQALAATFDPVTVMHQRSLLPTGPGQVRALSPSGVGLSFTEMDTRTAFFPDGKRILFPGSEKGHPPRVWVQDLDGGKARPITPEDVRRPLLLSDGRFVCAREPDLEWYLYPIDPVEKTEPRKVLGLFPGEEPIRPVAGGELMYVRGADELKPGETLMTTRVYRLDPWTGRRELWKEIPPVDPRTGGGIGTILFSADGKTCVYTHYRYSVELMLVDGLK
jgi:serine/threonine protein kinase